MAHTTSSRYQLDVETYVGTTLGMTAYPSTFDVVAQVLVPGTEYYATRADQTLINREIDANVNHVELEVFLRLLYRFITNEAEYTAASSTPTKLHAALSVLMDEKLWRGKGAMTTTQGIHEVVEISRSMERIGRVIVTDISVTLISTSV